MWHPDLAVTNCHSTCCSAAPLNCHWPAAHLLRVIDPATGKPLEANKLKAEVAAFMAAGEELPHPQAMLCASLGLTINTLCTR